MNRLYALDLSLCLQCNRVGAYALPVALFRTVSRLGDGILWYAVMALLPLTHGGEGAVASLHMAAVGGVALTIYRFLKHRTSRPRPCAVSPRVRQHSRALDQFSFPSGHTLHATAFTTALYLHFPATLWVFAPVTALIALSRPVLGLHYPSDVLAGAALGLLIALSGHALLPI